MKWRADRSRPGWAAGAALLLASCGGGDAPRSAGGQGRNRVASDVPVKIGKPYQVGGRWWTPSDDRTLDEVGYASWYGSDHQGVSTANGERFDRHRISAAHRTLPLPSYVEVTALDTGRTILVRVNDRGPFRAERVIDLSQAAARQLGIEGQGVARVRVRRADPPESERALLRRGRPAGYRVTLSAAERAGQARRLGVNPRPPATAAAPVAAALFVQVAALSDRSGADALSSLLRQLGPSAVEPAGSLWRVRMGPYRDVASVTAALAQVRARGYQDAHIATSADFH